MIQKTPAPRHSPRRSTRLRTRTLAALALAGSLVLVAVPGAAMADTAGGGPADGALLDVSHGRLLDDGAQVRVRVTYRCEKGQTAGVGIFLQQEDEESGSTVYGGAGSGQRRCTGQPETVRLVIDASDSQFSRGSAAAAVSLFVSGPSSAGKSVNVSDEIWLRPAH